MIFAVAFIDYDGDNELKVEQVDALSECEAMADVLESEYFDMSEFELAIEDNDTAMFQSQIDDLGWNIDIQARVIEF